MSEKPFGIYEMLPSLSYGDAVGNDALALKRVIAGMGYPTQIYASHVDGRLPRGTARAVDRLPRLDADDIVIYHMASGGELNLRFGDLPCRKVMIYHNITPPEYFCPYHYPSAQTVTQGLWEARRLAGRVDYCLAVSEFNKRDLREMGYTCPIDVRPILIPFADYAKKPSAAVMARYAGDGWTNLLFVGRIVPNKKQEDVIAAFAYYKKHLNPQSRLFLVGNYDGMERYWQRLRNYAEALGAEDVIFPGHIRFDEILAYYALADVFVCMSEHEGFGVPLAEAMYFDVPIIARAAAAVPDTLGGSGLLVDKPDPVLTAELIHGLVTDSRLRQCVLEEQRARLRDFSYEAVRDRFVSLMEGFIHG